MNQQIITVGIIGGAGYTGGELIRILLNHPNVVISFVQSNSNADNLVSKVHEDLIGSTDLSFSASHHMEVDLLFFCAGHGEAKKFLSENEIPDRIKLIDIGNDFRLKPDAVQGGRNFIYGLPECNRELIKNANSIANPGCFATAIQLGLLPLANAGLITDVYSTGITGSTGAGQSLSPTSHFSWRANNIQAYKTLNHPHQREILATLCTLQGNNTPDIHFVPWRGDFTRGIFISSQLKCLLSLDELYALYTDFYKDAAFVVVSHHPISLKQVVNTNKAVLQLEKEGNKLVIHSAIDNLLKGASGQAVQNMNLMFGLKENTGLQLKASGF
jgi:N-acetyl-gamma-glutamyl-phosphate reductase